MLFGTIMINFYALIMSSNYSYNFFSIIRLHFSKEQEQDGQYRGYASHMHTEYIPKISIVLIKTSEVYNTYLGIYSVCMLDA